MQKSDEERPTRIGVKEKNARGRVVLGCRFESGGKTIVEEAEGRRRREERLNARSEQGEAIIIQKHTTNVVSCQVNSQLAFE